MVTGASGGIGKAIALALAAHGADVLVAGRNPDKTRQAAAEVAASGRRAVPCSLEITSRASAEDMAAAAVKEFGRIDILVNSAGMNIRKEILSITDADWDQVLTTNLKGVLYCCQAVGKHMVQQAVRQDRQHRLDLLLPGPPGPRGLRLQQGRADPADPGHGHRVGPAPRQRERHLPVGRGHAVHRRAEEGPPAAWTGSWSASPWAASRVPDDVAGAAVFLASRAADFITGQNLFIDGGRTVD